MHTFLAEIAGYLFIPLMVIWMVAGVIGWFVSPRFREGWRRRTLFDDTFGFNLLNENRWWLWLTIAAWGNLLVHFLTAE